MKKKLLFVCIENSNRSQMSQAFANILGGDQVEAYSAGSKPSGIVNPKAIAAMKELGYDLSTHDSKSLDEVKAFAPFDVVVTMGCGDPVPGCRPNALWTGRSLIPNTWSQRNSIQCVILSGIKLPVC